MSNKITKTIYSNMRLKEQGIIIIWDAIISKTIKRN
jgi:hypothetical protein